MAKITQALSYFGDFCQYWQFWGMPDFLILTPQLRWLGNRWQEHGENAPFAGSTLDPYSSLLRHD